MRFELVIAAAIFLNVCVLTWYVREAFCMNDIDDYYHKWSGYFQSLTPAEMAAVCKVDEEYQRKRDNAEKVSISWY